MQIQRTNLHQDSKQPNFKGYHVSRKNLKVMQEAVPCIKEVFKEAHNELKKISKGSYIEFIVACKFKDGDKPVATILCAAYKNFFAKLFSKIDEIFMTGNVNYGFFNRNFSVDSKSKSNDLIDIAKMAKKNLEINRSK